MRHIFSLSVFLPLSIGLGVFAIENRLPLVLEIWPFSGKYEIPASACILGLLAAGILIGLAIGWLSNFRWRRRLRRAERTNRRLEMRLKDLTTEHPTQAKTQKTLRPVASRLLLNED